MALETVSVTSSAPTSASASCAGQRCSALRAAAAKPSSTRLLSLDESSARQDSTQWWLVSIRPWGETNEAVQFVSRIVDSRTWSSQARGSSPPYVFFPLIPPTFPNFPIPPPANLHN